MNIPESNHISIYLGIHTWTQINKYHRANPPDNLTFRLKQGENFGLKGGSQPMG
jgi:hypothetical protein